MQNDFSQPNRSTEHAATREEYAGDMPAPGYSFDAQLEDDAYLQTVTRKRPFTLVEAFIGLARRFTRH